MDDAVIEEKLDGLREELNQKHAQNRKDIHDLRNGQQMLLNKQHSLEIKLVPVLGNGKPGLVEKVDHITELLNDMRIEMASTRGLKEIVEKIRTSHTTVSGVWDFLRWFIPTLVAIAAILWGRK